jgi:hydrogenase maturation protein HypF
MPVAEPFSGSEQVDGRVIAPDLSICDACLAELRDPVNRRYRHAFVSCAACGPRYTVSTGRAAGRSATTMAGFTMCAACAREYAGQGDRHFQDPTVCCPGCGPRLRLVAPAHPTTFGEQALTQARTILHEGGVVAVKGVGGYHLVCDATNGYTVSMLRKRKQRGDEPFVVMVATLDDAQHVVDLAPAEAELLTSRARPVVLARRHPGALAAAVAPGQGDLGVMLAAEPLHYLLLGLPGDVPGPVVLVLTSGTVASEPIVIDDDEALLRLAGLADAWLAHDRPIRVPCDSSVTRAVAGREIPVRRSRGYVPLPVRLPFVVPPSLAVGGDAANSFCIADGRRAWMSGHLGDQDDPAAQGAFAAAVEHLSTLTGVVPQVVATDLHPGYASRQWALDRFASPDVVEVQHHHAHAASTMAEHSVGDGTRVIGVAFDGAGYGDDGASWGGEFLVADYHGYERAAHLAYVALPGAEAGVRNPCRMALSHLRSAGVPWDPSLPSVRACDDTELALLDGQLETGLRCVPTSSMGRLYDAVASLAGICHRAEYDAQALTELDALARPFALSHLDRRTRVYAFGEDGDPTPVIWSVVQDVRKGVDPGLVAARFQQSVVDLVVDTVGRLHERTRLSTVTLSGDLFLNAFLTAACVERLEAERFEVLTHRLVPAGDGGLALGQLAVLAHRSELRGRGEEGRFAPSGGV